MKYFAVSLAVISCMLLFASAQADTDESAKNVNEFKSMSPDCLVCKLAMLEVEKHLGKDRSGNKVENLVHGICKRMPHAVSAQCNKLIQKHSDQIIKFISNKGVPTAICSTLRLCAAEEYISPEVVEVEPEETVEVAKLKRKFSCDLCKLVTRELDQLLNTERNRNKVENAVHKVCNRLPDAYSEKCNDFIEKFGDQIINLILNKVVPEVICTALGICPKSEGLTPEVVAVESEKVVEEPVEEFGFLCEVCEKVIKELKKEITTDRTKEKVEKEVHRVCNRIHWISRQCNKFIDKHGGETIDWIVEHGVTNDICNQIKAC